MPTSLQLPCQFGRYRILQKLGEGGMGVVYLAEDDQLGRRVALKVPHFTPEDGLEIIERFYREARVAAAFQHPNICTIYDVGQINGIHYLTMPFIEGTPLSHRIRPDQPWPPVQASALVIRLAIALDAIHERGMMHRDLKPANILLRPGDEPVIMDFGLARSVAQSDRMTSTGALVGTPAYMSPEQVLGDPRSIGRATDIYSLGVIFYELITGRLPFAGPGAALYGQILHAEWKPPSSVRVTLDRQLDAICQKALAKKPGDRYPTMAKFAAALDTYLHFQKKALSERTTAGKLSAERAQGVRLVCPTCGKNLKVPFVLSAKKVRCPGCKSPLDIVADARTLTAPLPPSPVNAATTPTPLPSSSDTERQNRRLPMRQYSRTLVAGGVALTVLVALLITWVLVGGRAGQGHGSEELSVLPEVKVAPELKKVPESKKDSQPEPKTTQEPRNESPPDTKAPTEGNPAEQAPALTRVQPPRTERRELGKYILLRTSILLQQAQEKGIWQRVKPESPIYSTDYLVSLPGYRSELRLDSGVKMILWGNLPEFSRIPVLESAVTLHVNPSVQADFTLDHGRVVLSNMRKEGPVRIRLRFADEVWDLTLPDQSAELSVELCGVCVPTYNPDPDRGGPEISLGLLTLKGEVQLKIRYEEFLLSSPTLFIWDNISGASHGSRKLNGPPEWWTSKLPPKTPMLSALEGLSKRLIAEDSLDVAIAEMMKDPDPPSRTLALRCLGAMGELSMLLDALNDDRHPGEAVVGRQELLHFLGLSPKNDEKLVKLLRQKNYSEGQAQTVMQLLHGFSHEQWANESTRNALADYLTHEKLAIRHMSYMLLLALAPEGETIAYKPTGDIGQRQRGAEEWRKLLLRGKPVGKPHK